MLSHLAVIIFYYFILSNIAKLISILIISAQSGTKNGELKTRALVNFFTIIDIAFVFSALLFHNSLKDSTITDFLHLGITCHLHWSKQSLIYFCFSIGLMSLITRFSIFYLHRDIYFYKFFSLFFVLEISLIFLVLTTSMNSIFIGWELLGLSSVLLIAFYEHRNSTLKNSLLVLVIYKISDISLYSVFIYQLSLGIPP